MRLLLLLVAVLVVVFSVACSDLSKEQPKEQPKEQTKEEPKEQAKQEPPCTARFVPVGNNPDIALDTQTGSLCRTVAWVKAAGDEKPDKYTSLPVCSNAVAETPTHVFVPGKGLQTFSEWRKSQQESLCDNPDHTMTVSEVRKYAEKRGISPNDAGTEARQAGCEIK